MLEFRNNEQLSIVYYYDCDVVDKGNVMRCAFDLRTRLVKKLGSNCQQIVCNPCRMTLILPLKSTFDKFRRGNRIRTLLEQHFWWALLACVTMSNVNQIRDYSTHYPKYTGYHS